jgi:hypothetical protein
MTTYLPPTLQGLVATTGRLRCDLDHLLREHPDNDVDPRGRIFPRILSSAWRDVIGEFHGPHDRTYTGAARWFDEFYRYIDQLREYCFYVADRPRLFAKLPLNGSQKPPATKCVHLLSLQEGMLKRSAAKAVPEDKQELSTDEDDIRHDVDKDPMPGANQRFRTPDLETSKARLALQKQLRQELAAIHGAVKRYTTVEKLKERYPAFQLWTILSESEQRELLDGFTPKAYADLLVLRQDGLTSRETLKKDRRKLRDTLKRTPST